MEPARDSHPRTPPEPPSVASAGTGVASARRPAVRHRPMFWVAAGAVLALTVMILGLAIFLLLGIENSPLVNSYVRQRIVAALQERLDPALNLSIANVEITREEDETRIRVNGVVVRDSTGKTLVSAPSGRVSLETWAMLGMRLVPRDVTLEGLRADIEISETGSVAILSGSDPAATPDTPVAERPAAVADRLGHAIGTAFAGIAAAREAVGGRLPSLGVADASIRIVDRRSGRNYALTGINSRLESEKDGTTRAATELRTAGGPVAVNLELVPSNQQGQIFRAQTGKLTIGALRRLAGIDMAEVEDGTPVTLSLSAEVDRAHKAVSATIEGQMGRARMTVDGNAFALDEAGMRIAWKAGEEQLSVEQVSLVSGASRVALTGTIAPPEAGAEAWKVALRGKDARLDGLTPTDKPVEITAIRLDARILPETARLDIDRFEITGPLVSVAGKAGLYWNEAGQPGLDLDLGVQNTEARAALRLWPAVTSPEAHDWLRNAVRSGHVDRVAVRLAYPPDVFAAVLQRKPIPDDTLAVSWTVSRFLLDVLPGTHPLRNASGSGQANARSLRVDMPSAVIEPGQGRRIAVSDASFTIADMTRAIPESRTRLKFSGSVEAVADYLRSPGLQNHVPAAVDPSNLKGEAEGEVTIAIRLSHKPSPGDVRVTASSTMRNVTIDKAVGPDRIENATLTASIDRDTVLIKGDGKLYGANTAIEIRAAPKSRPRAVLSLTLDEAARARKGFNLAPMLTGPVGLKIASFIDGAANAETEIDLDVTRAKIDGLIPGWNKAAGQAGKATMDLNSAGTGWVLDDIVADSGSLSLRGTAQFSGDGTFQKASFKTFKLSPGDNVQLDADRAGGVTRIAVKGNSFDVRPFLRSLQVGTIDNSGGKDVEVALKTTVLSGFNGEIVANADLKLAMRGSELRKFDLTGGFDNGGVSTRLAARPNAQPQLIVDSEDAGAFLRFFDVYNRMRGGQLNMAATLGGGRQTGVVLIRDFTLRNEPAMKRLAADGNAGLGDGSRFDPAFVQRLNANQDVKFTKLQAEFTRSASRLDLKDAVMWGPELGGSIAGYLDYARDRVDLTGTFVPAYALNNFFAQVPVFGPLLGGGRNEGLFAVRYTIAGKVSAPTLSFNPLSAIAPGFLRKIVDFRGNAGRGDGTPLPPPSGSDR